MIVVSNHQSSVFARRLLRAYLGKVDRSLGPFLGGPSSTSHPRPYPKLTGLDGYGILDTGYVFVLLAVLHCTACG